MANTQLIEVEEHISNDEENQDDADIISLRSAKLLKLRHDIRKLRDSALSGFSKEIKECKEACSAANTLIGDLNDNIKKEGS